MTGVGWHQPGATRRRQVGGGRQRRCGRGCRQTTGPVSGRRPGAEKAVPGGVGGAAERRRAGRVGELDRDGLEQGAARVGRHDAVELLDGAFRLVAPVKAHEPDTLRQTCTITITNRSTTPAARYVTSKTLLPPQRRLCFIFRLDA